MLKTLALIGLAVGAYVVVDLLHIHALQSHQQYKPRGTESHLSAVYSNYGPAKDILNVKNVNTPTFTSKDVVIKVRAAALNPVDWKVMEGKLYPADAFFLMTWPRGTGGDVAGEVVEVGSSVTRLKKGDSVFVMLPMRHASALSEFVAVHERYVSLKPSSLSYSEAAGLPLVALTSLQAVRSCKVDKGDRVLLLGGSSATGMAGIQILKSMGVHVTTTASAKKAPLVQGLGADQVIDYRSQNWWDSEVAGQKYDAVYDCVGDRDGYQHSKAVLAPGGRFVTIALDETKGDKLATAIPHLISNIFTGLTGGGPSFRFVGVRSNRKDLDEVASLVRDGKMRSVIDGTFPFTQEGVTDAFAYQKAGRSVGKNIICVDGCD